MMEEKKAQTVSVRLTWTDPGDGTPRLLVTEPPIAIGRVSLNNITIKNDEISRYHARIEYEEGQFLLIDQASTNGSFLNGERTYRAALSEGDQIQVGPVTITVAFGLEGEKRGKTESGKLSGLSELDKTAMLPPSKNSKLRLPEDNN